MRTQSYKVTDIETYMLSKDLSFGHFFHTIVFLFFKEMNPYMTFLYIPVCIKYMYVPHNIAKIINITAIYLHANEPHILGYP